MRKNTISLVKNVVSLIVFTVVIVMVTLSLSVCPVSDSTISEYVGLFKGLKSVKSDSTTRANTRRVLLLTSGRSGSTFTSAIINRHPGIFYTNEPLHGMPKDIYQRVVSNTTAQKALYTVSSFLNCEFTKLDPFIIKSTLLEASKSTKGVFDCLRQPSNGYAHVSCFLSMWNSCLDHNITFVKTIRFRANWIKQLMEKTPNVKILFLVRDFRAVLHSYARVFKNFEFSLSGVSERAVTMCEEIRDQLEVLTTLKSLYPNAIRGVRYEDGSIDPVGYAKAIYEFLGFPFDQAVQNYVEEITSSSRINSKKNYDYDMMRRDPVATMNKWRKSVNLSIAMEIDRQCGDMYEALGYVPVNSEEELTSDNFFLMKDPKSGGIF